MDTSSALVAYRLQVMMFLQSLSIKYTPISDAYNALLISKGYAVNTDEPETWKYYLNLAGEYHAADTPMTVMSLDTKTEVPFTKTTLATHPLTSAAYRPGLEDYNLLCDRYPDQVDLIKSIVYPVTDIQEAIAAEELTVLAYGPGILEVEEQASVLQDIASFLDLVGNRWNLDWLRYEAYYHVAFMGLLWQSLASCIFSTRVKNLHTSAVHSFHIWEYLASNGVGDFRDVLPRRAALYLYRNIKYIIANRGKASTLTLLVNRLLTENNIGLVGKTIRQQTADSVDTCEWVPELISETVPTEFAGMVRMRPNEDVATMTYRLYEMGVETDISGGHVVDLTRKMGATPLNSLPTKLLEIAPVTLDRKYADVLVHFMIDSLVSAVVSDRYAPVIDITDAVTGTRLRMSGRDALALYYYSAHRVFYETPVNLPIHHNPKFTYRYDIASRTLPSTLIHRGSSYPMNSLLDVGAFVSGSVYPPGVRVSATDFVSTLTTQFLALVRQINTSRNATDRVVSLAVQKIFSEITTSVTYGIQLSSHTTYATWLQDTSQNNYLVVTSAYEASGNAQALYSALCEQIIKELLPLNDTLRAYANEESTSALYGRLKQLFVQLCSYNVQFLDTPRDVQHWIFATKTDYDVIQVSGSTKIGHDPTSDVTIIHSGSEPIEVPITDYGIVVTDTGTETAIWNGETTLHREFLITETVQLEPDTTPDIYPATATIPIRVPDGIGIGVSFTYTP